MDDAFQSIGGFFFTDHQEPICLDDVTYLWGHFVSKYL